MLKLKTSKRRVLEAGTQADQLREAQLLHPQLIAERTLLEGQEQQLRDQFKTEYAMRFGENGQEHDNPITIQREQHIAIILRIGTIAVTALDTGLSANLATTWLDLPERNAALAGGVAALAMAYACKATVAAAFVDSKQPLKSRRLLKIASISSAVVNGSLLGLLFATRSPSKDLVDFVLHSAGVLFGVLALSLPTLAGCLWALADNYGWSKPLAKRFHWNVARRAEITGVESWLAATYRIVSTAAGANNQPATAAQTSVQHVNGAAAGQPPAAADSAKKGVEL